MSDPEVKDLPAEGPGVAAPGSGDGESTQGPGPRRRGGSGPVWRLLRLLLGVTVQVLLLVLVLLGLILGTQTGLRAAFAVAQELAPDLIRVEQVQGRVLGRLHLRGLEVQVPGLDLNLGGLDLDWAPFAVLTGTLPIHRLRVQDIGVELGPSEEKPREPLVLPEVVLPIGIDIDEVLVERLRVSEAGAEAPLLVLDRAVLSARLRGSELDLRRLEADLSEPRVSARASGEAELRDQYPLGLDLAWELTLPPAARLGGQGRVSGDLEQLHVTHEVSGSARVSLDAEVREVLQAASWTGRIQVDGVDLPAFLPTAPPVDLTGRIETAGDLGTATATGTLDAKASELPDFGHLAANLSIEWKERILTLRALDLGESVSGAKVTVRGILDLRQKPDAFQVKGAWERLRWPLSGDLLVESPQGGLDASGSLDAYTYALSGRVQGPAVPALDLVLDGTGDAEGTRIEPLEVHTLDGTLTAKGDVTWVPGVTWDLALKGEGLNPAGIAPGIEDRVGLTLETQGGLDAFQYSLAANTQGPGLPPAQLSLHGRGDLQGSEMEALRLDVLNGRLDGQGRVAWDPKLGWDAWLSWADIDPGVLAPEWPGRLAGRIESKGSLEPDGPHLSALIDGVQGELREFPVAAKGRVEMEGRSIRIQGLEASSGPTRLQVDGTAEETGLDLAFDLNSPDLGTLLPDAKGSLGAKGRLGGTLEAPEVRLDLSAKGVEAAGQGVGSLEGAVDLVVTPTGPFDVRIQGSDLLAGGLRFGRLEVRGEGRMPDHRLSLSLTGEPLAVRLEAGGVLAQDWSYQGSLRRLELDSVPWGDWRLQRPMPVKLAGSQIGAGPLCLRNGQGSGGCLGFDQEETGHWSADIDLDRLGAELIEGLLPPDLAAEGAVRVKGRFEAQGAVVAGSAVAEVPQGRLQIFQAQGGGEVIDFSRTRLTLASGAAGISSQLDLPMAGLGAVMGNLELPGWRLDQASRPDQSLRGNLRARVDGLARVSKLVPSLTGVTGSIAADLNLSGTLARPDLQGQASARGLGGEVPLIGLKLADFNINFIASGDRLDLQGQGDVGGGRLELSGAYALAPGGAAGRARLQGERLRVANTKEYQAVVSPSLDLVLNPEGLQVRGEVKVPEARIHPRSLPAGTVSPSPDVVMLDKSGQSEGSSFPLDLDIRLLLGKDVTIDAFGVRGRLTGDLRVFQQPGKPVLGDGQLGIVDGVYRLSAGFRLAAEFGAPLTIEQGRLVFAKSPIDNPGLLLQAQREGTETTAGVRVHGTLRNPKLAFFSDSDPELTPSEISTYLVTGVPPRNDSGSQDRSLSFGTYVKPKLYMEYETGLGDQKDKVKLRYDLTRRIELQTETGESQGGDIFFKFER